MKLSTDELAKILPDYDDLMELSNEVLATQKSKLLLEQEIKAGEANVVTQCTTDVKYLQGGKVPSMSFIESTYKHTGLNNELLELRKQYATLTAELDYLKMRYDIFKQVLDIWRTLSANERRLV